MVAEGVVMDSGMWWGNLGWLHTSSASLKAWGLDPCVVAGLCRHFKMMEHVVGTCGGSSHGYGGRGVYTKVVWWVYPGLLHKTECVTLWSHDLTGFQKWCVVSAVGRCRCETGCIWACGWSMGGHTVSNHESGQSTLNCKLYNNDYK